MRSGQPGPFARFEPGEPAQRQRDLVEGERSDQLGGSLDDLLSDRFGERPVEAFFRAGIDGLAPFPSHAGRYRRLVEDSPAHPPGHRNVGGTP
jgi:hypothetical protein